MISFSGRLWWGHFFVACR